MQKKALIIAAHGVEEMELVTPLDILRRGGVETHLVSASSSLVLTGRNNIKITADKTLGDLADTPYDILIIPGGTPNVNALMANHRVLQLLRNFAENQKPIAAICAGPLVLKEANLISNIRLTSHPAVGGEFKSASKEYSTDPCVVDGLFTTSRGAGTAERFAFCILEQLAGEETCQRVHREIASELPL